MSIPEILQVIWNAVIAVGGALESIPDRALIYATVVCCTISLMGMALYVRRKFSTARRTLAVLSTEWQTAETEFLKISDVAQRKMNGLASIPGSGPASTAAESSPPERVGAGTFPLVDAGPDLPRQVAAMARRGLSAPDIAATLGLGEADVNVLFGMHRVTQRKK